MLNSVRTYKPFVRVGNWQEDIALQEEAAREFERRRLGGTLLLSRAQTVLSAAATQHRISKTEDGCVHYGDSLVVRHAGSGRVVSYVAQSSTTEADVLHVSGAPGVGGMARLQRNVFTIAPGSGQGGMQPGAPLCFADRFTLVAVDPFGHERYLHSQLAGLHGGVSLLSGKQSVTLAHPKKSEKISHDDVWEVVCIDPSIRLETEGQPVPANVPVVLRHVASNQPLAMLETHLVRSELGAEPEMACHGFYNQQKVPQPANHFVLELDSDVAAPASAGGAGGAEGAE